MVVMPSRLRDWTRACPPVIVATDDSSRDGFGYLDTNILIVSERNKHRSLSKLCSEDYRRSVSAAI